jgi:hypothetical protein
VNDLISTVDQQLDQLQLTVAEMARRLRTDPQNRGSHA